MEEQRLEEMGAFFDARSKSYDEVHTGHIGGGLESKHVPALYLPEGCKELLDLGIGTGLELETVFQRFPEVRVTGSIFPGKCWACSERNTPIRSFFYTG